MENRHGLIVDGCVTKANGHAERTAAPAMIEKRTDRVNRVTLGADKDYDAENFVNELRSMNIMPHIARSTAGRRSTLDERTTRYPATRSASASANESRRVSAGARSSGS